MDNQNIKSVLNPTLATIRDNKAKWNLPEFRRRGYRDLHKINRYGLLFRSDAVLTLDIDINNLRDQRTKINSQISEITINGQKRIQDILNTGSNKDAIAQLQSQIDTLTNDISTLSAKKADLPNQIKKIGILKTNEKSILAEIAAIEKTIINKEKEKRIKEEKIADLIKQQSVNTSGQVDIIKNEITLAIKPLNEELEIISAKIND